MFQWITVHFRCACLQQAYASTSGQAQHVRRPEHRGFHGFDGIVLIVLRTCRAGQIINVADLDFYGINNVVTNYFQVAVVVNAFEISPLTREEVVHAHNIESLVQERFAQVRSDETRTARDKDCVFFFHQTA